MLNVLIACEYNSGRSQIACTYLNEYGGSYFRTECCGLEPRPLNPLVVLAMREDGYRIDELNNTFSVTDLIQLERHYEIVISVCSEETDKRFPVFPGCCVRLNWEYDDPGKIGGGRLERLQKVRDMRDGIKKDVSEFIKQYESNGLKEFLAPSTQNLQNQHYSQI